jgi:hypothetical protein
MLVVEFQISIAILRLRGFGLQAWVCHTQLGILRQETANVGREQCRCPRNSTAGLRLGIVGVEEKVQRRLRF